MIELVTEWFYKLKSFPYLDLVIGITNWDEISWDEDDTFEKAIQMGIYVHDKCIELLNKQNAWRSTRNTMRNTVQIRNDLKRITIRKTGSFR